MLNCNLIFLALDILDFLNLLKDTNFYNASVNIETTVSIQPFVTGREHAVIKFHQLLVRVSFRIIGITLVRTTDSWDLSSTQCETKYRE